VNFITTLRERQSTQPLLDARIEGNKLSFKVSRDGAPLTFEFVLTYPTHGKLTGTSPWREDADRTDKGGVEPRTILLGAIPCFTDTAHSARSFHSCRSLSGLGFQCHRCWDCM
jgi:hypothetical protein